MRGKKSFILYTDLIHVVETLEDNEAGALLKHLLRYVNDLNPEPPDRLTQIVFEPIRQQLKRDLGEWSEKLAKRAEAGRLGGAKSGEARASKTKQNEAKVAFASKNEANEAVNVNVNVNVKEKGNVVGVPPTPEDTDYKDCIEVYNNFIKKLTGGAGAKFDGQQGKAMKAIIAYIKGQAKTSGASASSLLDVVFANWHKIEPFLQQQTTLSQINSNLQNIIIQIKNNGKSIASNNEQKIGRIGVDALRDFIAPRTND